MHRLHNILLIEPRHLVLIQPNGRKL